MNSSFRKEVISSCHGCSKIILGEEKIKKVEKIYGVYGIPKNETILAHVKSSVFLMSISMDGAIITDQAYYFHPCHDDWAKTNRFPFSDICRYIVSQKDEKGHVILSDASGDYTIWSSTLFGKNITGMELVRFLKNMQTQIFQNYSWAAEQQRAAGHALLEAFRTKLQRGSLPERDLNLLHTLESYPTISDEATSLEAESIARLCDEGKYTQFISGLSPQLRCVLESSYNQFLQGLENDLSNITLEFDRQYLDTVYQTLSVRNELSDLQCSILAYVCIRNGKLSQFSVILPQIRNQLGEHKEQQLLIFQGQLYNQRMQQVFEAVAGGKMPEDFQLQWADSIGLTPLHYAIILRRPELVDKLIEKKKWKPEFSFSQECNASNLYDYNVVACFAGFPERAHIFQSTSDLVLAQKRSVDALRKKIWFKKQRLEVQKKTEQSIRGMIRTGKKNGLPDEKIESFYIQLDTINNLRQDTIQEILELEQDISDIESEIDNITEYGLLQAATLVQQLRASDDPLVKYIIQIYENPEFLRHVLFDGTQSCKLYQYNGIFFVTPYDVVLDLPYSDINGNRGTTDHATHDTHKQSGQQGKETGAIVHPFGASWFSPEAHKDRKVLKKEYYKLAKQYHPDVCNHINSKQIFQEILNERANILESMSDE